MGDISKQKKTNLKTIKPKNKKKAGKVVSKSVGGSVILSAGVLRDAGAVNIALSTRLLPVCYLVKLANDFSSI